LLAVALMAVACTDSGSGHFSAGLTDIGGGRKMYMECDGVFSQTRWVNIARCRRC